MMALRPTPPRSRMRMTSSDLAFAALITVPLPGSRRLESMFILNFEWSKLVGEKTDPFECHSQAAQRAAVPSCHGPIPSR